MGTIAAEISALRQRISEAYDVIDRKGGDVPLERTSWNLSASIESIPTGSEPEAVNGISSLYAVQPELQSDGTFTGTQRNGPYHLDLSYLTNVASYAYSPACLVGRCGLWSYDDLSTQAGDTIEEKIAQWTNLCPNVSSIDIHNIQSVTMSYGCGYLACGNLNVLSARMPENLTNVGNIYALASTFRGTRVACDLTSLTGCSQDYAFNSTWLAAQPKYNPLSADLEERYLPNLQMVNGAYAFQGTWNAYRPAKNGFADFSNLTAINGNYAFTLAFAYSEVSRIRFGVSTIDYQPSGKKTSNNVFDRFALDADQLTSVEFPNLTSINATTTFTYAFENCSKLSSIEFPALKSIGKTTNANWYGTQTFFAMCQSCQALTSVSFPELETCLTAGTNRFTRIFHSAGAGANTWPIAHLHLPKLVTFRSAVGSAANAEFNTMSSQATSNQRRRYAVHIGAEVTTPQTWTVGTTAGGSLFYQSRGLVEVYLHSVSNIINNFMFSNCYELTAIHFAAAYEESIKATTGYATLWGRGAGAATVYFDL